jgi:hypothetical protein
MIAMAAKIVPTDNYFKNENGLISEWQLDRETYIDYELKMLCLDSFCSLFYLPIGPIVWPVRVAMFAICDKYNIEDLVNAKHVCLTDDGVIYIIEKHKTLCRVYCQDEGKKTTLMSYEKITDVSVEEPAGAMWCGLVPNVLYTVTIQTAGAPTVIVGLKDALNFKKEVLRVKKEKEPKPMMDMMHMMQMQQQPQQMMIMPQSGQQQQMMMPQGGQQTMQAGQPQMYIQQAGQPNAMLSPQMTYAQPVPMEMDRGFEVNKNFFH